MFVLAPLAILLHEFLVYMLPLDGYCDPSVYTPRRTWDCCPLNVTVSGNVQRVAGASEGYYKAQLRYFPHSILNRRLLWRTKEGHSCVRFRGQRRKTMLYRNYRP